MKFKNDLVKTIEGEYKSGFDDYRDKDEEEMEKYINEKVRELPIHQFLQQLKLNDFLWDFDAVSLYPSAMNDDKNIYPRLETGYGFTPDMSNCIVEKINIQTLTRGSAILNFR